MEARPRKYTMGQGGIIARVKRPRSLPWLALLALAALALRLAGIAWGLPDQYRAWSFHPDESQVLVAALALDAFSGRLDSGFYNYGQGYLLLVGTVVHGLETFGLLPVPGNGVPPHPLALFTARLITALLGSASCVFVTLAGFRLYGVRTGWTAGVLMAVAPLAVQHAHFATVDVPAMAAVSFALLAVAIARESPRTTWWVATGLASGFAAATKYNAGLVLLAGLAAWAFARPRRLVPLAALVSSTAAGFAIACPGALINFPRFREDLLFEAAHMGSGSENIFYGTAPGWVHHAMVNMPWTLGPVLAVCLVPAMVSMIRRRSRPDLILLAFGLPYYLLVGAAQVKFARYLIPMLPVITLWLAAWSSAIGSGSTTPRQRFSEGAMRAGIAMAAMLSVALISVFMKTDPRDQAARHLRKSGATRVAFARRPWYWSPPLAPGLAHFSPVAAWRSAQAWNGTPTLAAPDLEQEWSLPYLDNSAADAVVVSEIEAEDSLRLGEQRVLQYWRGLPERFPRRTVFESRPGIGSIDFLKPSLLQDFPVQVLPHDMTYANPVVVVFQK